MPQIHPLLALPLEAGETPASYVSRLAWQLRVAARAFCLDLGVNFQQVVDGEPEALARLAEALRTDIGQLSGQALIRKESGYRIGSESLPRTHLVRSHLRLCPACATEDLARGFAVPYLRTIWQVRAIRTCCMHEASLVTVAEVTSPQLLHDHAQVIGPRLDELKNWKAGSVGRPPSGLEEYILERIAGNEANLWLDRFELHAVISLCEMAGAVRLFGIRFEDEALSEDDRHAAGREGFLLLKDGPEGIRALLAELMQRSRNEGSRLGFRSTFGRLYEWLAYQKVEEESLEPMRNIICDMLIDLVPVGAGEVVLGRKVSERKRHSIHSAAKESGLHPKTLRKALKHLAIIDSRSDALTDHWVILDAGQIEPLLTELKTAMNLKDAAAFLGLPRPLDRMILLHDPPFIAPLIGRNDLDLAMAFSRQSLEEFRERLYGNATGINDPRDDLVPVREAAKRLNCSNLEILELMLDRRIETFREGDELRFESLLVNLEEVRPFIHTREAPGLTPREVEVALNTSTRVVKALIASGILPATLKRHPVKRDLQLYVLEKDLDAFRQRYVSLHSLCLETGLHWSQLKRQLEDHGIQPAFDPRQLHASFYERKDVEGVVGGRDMRFSGIR